MSLLVSTWTDNLCFNQDGSITYLNEKSLKLDKFAFSRGDIAAEVYNVNMHR